MKATLARFSATPRRIVVGLLVFGAACHHAAPVPAPTPAPTAPARPSNPNPVGITSGAALVQAMHDRYNSTWYKGVAMRQKTTLSLPSGGEIVQTWYESARLPGRLRIDTDLKSKSGQLFVRDSIFMFSGGKLVSAESRLNELLVLLFNIYTQPATRSLTELRGLDFDLTRFHESQWQGVPVYVVGANRGDTTSKQFWVERERLLVVRMIYREPQGRADTRFSQYAPYAGGWVAGEITQLVNGKRRILEQYSDIRVNSLFSEGFFEPKQWATAAHWVPR